MGVLGAVALAVVGAVAVLAAPAVAAPPGTGILSWGDNTYGQLGDNTNTARRVPGAVVWPDELTVTSVEAGQYHSLALTSTGQVYAWGVNSKGELGDGTTTKRDTPTLVDLPSGTVATDISAGPSSGLALTSTGDVYAWGYFIPAYGKTPTEITFPAGITIVDVVAGMQADYALTSTGAVYAWGSNNYGQLGNGTTTNRATPDLVNLPGGMTATAIADGYNTAYALTSSGQIYAWGYNGNGQIGDGTTTNRLTPVQVQLPSGVTAETVVGGLNQAYLVTPAGAVYAWGTNALGQLGDGTTTNRTTPVQTHLPAGTVVTTLAAGSSASHALALTATGDVYAWGWNTSGQLGDGTTTNRTSPVPLSLPEAAVATGAFAAGWKHSLAVVNHQPGLGWGFNASGQVGDSTLANRNTPGYLSMPADTVLTGVGAGYQHSLAVADDGTIYTWGNNAYGQLGTGDTTNRSAPTTVSLPAGETATEVEGGQYHSLALTEDGDVYAWGRNNSGQLGTGTTSTSTTPVKVTGFPAGTVIVAVATSNVHNVAMGAAGEVFTWGDNTFGQLGDGTTTTRRSPTPITLPNSDVASGVAAGAFHTLAMTLDGGAYAWGYNLYGQLGTGNNTNANTPTAVQLGTTFVVDDIDAGLNHSLAVTDDGRAIAWGAGTVGQLGNGAVANSNVPVTVNLPDGVAVNAVAGGQSHSLAVVDISTNPAIKPGQILAWGLNNYGQLGDGTTTARTSPVITHQPDGTIAIQVAGGQFHSVARLTR